MLFPEVFICLLGTSNNWFWTFFSDEDICLLGKLNIKHSTYPGPTLHLVSFTSCKLSCSEVCLGVSALGIFGVLVESAAITLHSPPFWLCTVHCTLHTAHCTQQTSTTHWTVQTALNTVVLPYLQMCTPPHPAIRPHLAHTFFGLIVIQQDREGNVRMLHYTEVFVTGLTFLRDLNLMLFFLLNCNYYINVTSLGATLF